MEIKFNFDHEEKHFSKALPTNLDPMDIPKFMHEIGEKEGDISKSLLLEKIIEKVNPKNANDILVLGMAFGNAHTVYSMTEQMAHHLPPPEITKALFENILERAYGKENSYQAYGVDREGFESHLSEKKNDF
tara:strand:- start:12 stop:407 length:396 start_codon:yes stop_codon:yes gene_type:complete